MSFISICILSISNGPRTVGWLAPSPPSKDIFGCVCKQLMPVIYSMIRDWNCSYLVIVHRRFACQYMLQMIGQAKVSCMISFYCHDARRMEKEEIT